MKHAIILAHPEANSFNASVAKAYERAAGELGHRVIVRDLYAMGFDPCLRGEERPDKASPVRAADVAAEHDLLADVDVFALIYPMWFGAPPAILKGYIERVFSRGFAFEQFESGQMQPLLTNRRLISFTSSGSTKAWLEESGVWLSMQHLMDRYLSKLFGLQVVDHVHFPSISSGLDKRWVMENLETVRTTVLQQFGPAKSPG